MRIDNSNKPDGVHARGAEGVQDKPATERSKGNSGATRGDSLELSRLASAVRTLSLRIVSDDTAVRSMRLQELKEAVRNGTFAPDPSDTAGAMLDHVTE